MGKTKTSYVAGVDEAQTSKPSYDKAKKQAKRKAKDAAHAAKSRVKEISMDVPQVESASVDQTETTVDTTSKKKEEKVRSVKYKEAQAKVDKNRTYSLDSAINLVKETSYSTFDGTMELHIVIKKTGFSVNVTLPHSAGKAKRVEVADDTTVEKLKTGKVDFDVLLATAEMMPKLVPFARLLGPRGLMPNPKIGTLIKTAKDAEKFSGNTKTLKTEKSAPVIHTSVGKVSQKDEELIENIESVFNAINKKQIVRVYLKSTMSPSVKVNVGN